MQRLCGIDFVCGHDPWAEAPRLVEVFALRDVQASVAQPVPHTAFVAQRKTSDHGQRRLAGYMAPLLPDQQHDHALIVEFVRYFWLPVWLVRYDQRSIDSTKEF